jgi:transposase
LLSAEGRTSGELSRILKAPPSAVSDWLRNFEAHGVEGVLEGHRCGRPPGLSEQQRVTLADIVDSGPVAYGLDTGV